MQGIRPWHGRQLFVLQNFYLLSFSNLLAKDLVILQYFHAFVQLYIQVLAITVFLLFESVSVGTLRQLDLLISLKIKKRKTKLQYERYIKTIFLGLEVKSSKFGVPEQCCFSVQKVLPNAALYSVWLLYRIQSVHLLRTHCFPDCLKGLEDCLKTLGA